MSNRFALTALSILAAVLIVPGCGRETTPTGPGSVGAPSGPSGPSPVQSVSVTASRTTFGIDQTTQFEATARRQDGTSGICTSTAVWQSSNASAVAVSAGLARGIAMGEAELRATCDGVAGAVKVTINSVHAKRVTVSPGEYPNWAILVPGQTQQLTANVCFSDGTCEDCTARASWENLSRDVLAIDARGQVTATAVGDNGAVRVHCGPPFTYAFVRVRLPDDRFGHRVEPSGALCGSPAAPGSVSNRCLYGGDSVQSTTSVDVARAGSMQISLSAIGGHDYGDSLDVEVRCGERLARRWSSGMQGTFAIQVEPCRYEIKVMNPMAYGQQYRMIVQYP